MSIADLWDHRAVLYRPSAGGVDANGDPTDAITLVTTPSGLNARADVSWTGGLGVSPIGETQTDTRVWGLDKGFTDIEERDVMDIVTGPMAPTRCRILSVSKPTDRRGVIHHVEVATKVYSGGIA